MDYVKNRKIFFIISALIILTGVVFYFINGFNYGIDFTGGTVFEIHADNYIEEEKVREIFEEIDNTISVLYSGDDKSDIIVKSTKDFNSAEIGEIKTAINDKLGVEKEKVSSDSTGATMGKEIQRKAIISVLVAGALMLLYITIRFELKFGIAAVLALLHDILITLSFYAIFKFPFNSSLIAAILTIVGYSINATIIIFDRIREERRSAEKRSIEEIINLSINKTIRRSIITTATTLLAVFTLYFVGVESVKVLALPLIIGLTAGAYSSVCIASNLWYELNRKKKA
ncbi:MAG: protein translocase subunit SecF [Ezakiella sp.]|nr:protein translocase subunit SecF [Ezakiella sp.]MDD7761830.1 protein translocase subunit SecF [Bacillota bacterium]MDY3946645.1 protein translocase subunit SecF [Ezakiella sp.]